MKTTTKKPLKTNKGRAKDDLLYDRSAYLLTTKEGFICSLV